MSLHLGRLEGILHVARLSPALGWWEMGQGALPPSNQYSPLQIPCQVPWALVCPCCLRRRVPPRAPGASATPALTPTLAGQPLRACTHTTLSRHPDPQPRARFPTGRSSLPARAGSSLNWVSSKTGIVSKPDEMCTAPGAELGLQPEPGTL